MYNTDEVSTFLKAKSMEEKTIPLFSEIQNQKIKTNL